MFRDNELVDIVIPVLLDRSPRSPVTYGNVLCVFIKLDPGPDWGVHLIDDLVKSDSGVVTIVLLGIKTAKPSEVEFKLNIHSDYSWIEMPDDQANVNGSGPDPFTLCAQKPW